MLPQRVYRCIRDIVAINSNAAVFGIVKAEQQSEYSRFSTTRLTDQGSRRAGLAVEGQPIQSRFPGIIGEFDVFKRDVALALG